MIEINIPFKNINSYKNVSFMKLHHASNHAVILAEWCKEQGLIIGLDFEWAVWRDAEKISFKFMNKGEKYSSLFALKFGDGSA